MIIITKLLFFFVFFSANTIILFLDFKVAIVNIYAEHFCIKKDLKSDPKEALEAWNP
jgi:predicted membrane protein